MIARLANWLVSPASDREIATAVALIGFVLLMAALWYAGSGAIR
jgi:hypothetical protein